MKKNPLLKDLPEAKTLIDEICRKNSFKKYRKGALKDLGYLKIPSKKELGKPGRNFSKYRESQILEYDDFLRKRLIHDLRYVVVSVPFKMRQSEAGILKKRMEEYMSVARVDEVIRAVMVPEKLNMAYIEVMEAINWKD